MNERYILAIHAFGNNTTHVHDVSAFKAMQFAPLLDDFWKKFPGNI
jgi:hypothetical protein